MKTVSLHKITITCTGCNSSYTIPFENDINEYSMDCKNCSKKLKVIRCLECGSHYSITYSDLKKDRYSFTCQKCKNTFVINFNTRASKNDGTRTKDETRRLTLPREKSKKKSKSVLNKNIRDTKKDSENTTLKTAGKTIKSFSISEILHACAQAFTLGKIITASAGSSALLAVIFIYNSIKNGFQNFPLIQNIIFSIFLTLIFYLYTMTSALISKGTITEILLNRKIRNSELILFGLKISVPLLFSNALILLFLNGLIFLFGKIPFIGPVTFSLLFLPVYLSTAFLVALITIGFWFYPPILAHRMTGIKSNVTNIYHFIKKHNLTLIYIIPILLITASLSFGAIYLIHYWAFKISTIGAVMALGQNADKIFSAIPGPLTRLSSFSFMASDMSLFKGLYETISLSFAAGGFILGIIFSAITIVLMAIAVSIVATLSTHVYIFMEREIEASDKTFLQVLSALVMVLLALLLFQKIFL